MRHKIQYQNRNMTELNTTTLKLTGENWAVWKFQITVILKSRGYYEIVTGKTTNPTQEGDELSKWFKEDSKAQELLVTRMEQGPLTHILSCESSYAMWQKLKTVYDMESTVSIHLLQQKFFMLEFQNSVSEFISHIEDIKNKLRTAGEELSEKIIITKILMALPEKYKHFRSAWESAPSDKQTLEELTSRLLLEEERYKSQESSTALSAKVSGQGQTRIKCHICAKFGHIARNCYFRNKNNKRTENVGSSENKNKKFCSHCKRKSHNIDECWIKRGKENSTKPSDQAVSNAFMISSG